MSHVITSSNLHTLFQNAGSRPIHLMLRHADRDPIKDHYAATELNALGEVNAREAGVQLHAALTQSNKKIARVISSPVKRCIQTATHLLAAQNTPQKIQHVMALEAAKGSCARKQRQADRVITVFSEKKLLPFILDFITEPNTPLDPCLHTASAAVKILLTTLFKRPQKQDTLSLACTHDLTIGCMMNHLIQIHRMIRSEPLITTTEELWVPRFTEMVGLWKTRDGSLHWQLADRTYTLSRRELKAHKLI